MMLTNPQAEKHDREIRILRKMIKGLESQMVKHQFSLDEIQSDCIHQHDVLSPISCVKCGKPLVPMAVGLN